MLDLSLVLRDADDLITSLVPEKLRAKETRKNINKEDYLRALQYQQKLIDIMIKYIHINNVFLE